MDSTQNDDQISDRGRTHFVGIAGSGMSALAQYRAMGGLETSGSDRSFDQGTALEERAALQSLGIVITPQDGTGVVGATSVVASTAVESRIEDLVRARELGIPIIHRSVALARELSKSRSIAIAGTSGKSTVTAMTFEILARTGADPSLITGGDLLWLREKGHRGNAWRGRGPLVVEADESDGSLIQHSPCIGTLLNLHRDHMETEKVLEQFRIFRRQIRERAIVAADPALSEFADRDWTFGFGGGAAFEATSLELDRGGSTFRCRGIPIRVSIPGAHNAENALAALVTAHAAGIPLEAGASALRDYAGVARRFQRIGSRGGVVVIDDFAHNPAKAEAAIQAAQSLSKSVHAFFQPHGFGPTRFMRQEFVERVARSLRPKDQIFLGEIYFAGGTVVRDISSADLVSDLREKGARARFLEHRQELTSALADDVQEGDLVLVMGARDASLSEFARSVLEALPTRDGFREASARL